MVALDAVLDHRRTTNLALRATMQATFAIGRSHAVLVAMVRHLWLNLSGLKEKEIYFLLDASVLPSGLFGAAIESVVQKFKEGEG